MKGNHPQIMERKLLTKILVFSSKVATFLTEYCSRKPLVGFVHSHTGPKTNIDTKNCHVSRELPFPNHDFGYPW